MKKLVSILSLAVATSHAGPMIPPGDIALRHDIQLLADHGIITGPVTTWPLEWGPILADLQSAETTGQSPFLLAAIQRVMSKGNWDTATGELRFRARAAVQAEPLRLRSFQDTPRDEAEVSGGLTYIGDWFSVDLNVTGVSNPQDDKHARGDGSQVAVALGNTTIAVSTLDRWWGPAWDSSLVMSSNARPFPALTINRRFTDQSGSKWFRWLGPWDASLVWGVLEEERVIPNAQFVGFRFNFRPTPSLEVGVTRTAQWCGDGRPCGAETFWDIVVGKDNPGDEGVTSDSDPSNQSATLDFRWSATGLGWPVAVYGQFMGEDEAGGFPSRYLGQIGIDGHMYLADRWSLRWYLEGSATNCEFWKSEDNWNCGYNHSIYKTGYRYRGRVIGHTADNDARVATAGVVLVDHSANSWQAVLRHAQLNRGGAPDPRNTLTASPKDVLTIGLVHHRVTRFGRFEFGAGLDHIEDNSSRQSSNDARGFIQWRSDY